MKKLCGVTKAEIIEGFVFGVEVEHEDGHRQWVKGNIAESKANAKYYSEKGMFSDFDAMSTYSQPEHLKEVSEFWFQTQCSDGNISMNELFDKYAKEV